MEQENTKEKNNFFIGIIKENMQYLVGVSGKNKKQVVRKVTLRIAYTALLTAIGVLFNVYTINPTKELAISFISIPALIAGILLGPISGFAVGILADLIGCIIAPHGPFIIMLSISSGLFGFIPGIVFLVLRTHPHLKILISYFLSLIICTCLLNTLGLWITYNKCKVSFWVYLLPRFPWQLINSVINWILATLLFVALQRAKIIKIPKKVKEKKVKAETP